MRGGCGPRRAPRRAAPVSGLVDERARLLRRVRAARVGAWTRVRPGGLLGELAGTHGPPRCGSWRPSRRTRASSASALPDRRGRASRGSGRGRRSGSITALTRASLLSNSAISASSVAICAAHGSMGLAELAPPPRRSVVFCVLTMIRSDILNASSPELPSDCRSIERLALAVLRLVEQRLLACSERILVAQLDLMVLQARGELRLRLGGELGLRLGRGVVIHTARNGRRRRRPPGVRSPRWCNGRPSARCGS